MKSVVTSTASMFAALRNKNPAAIGGLLLVVALIAAYANHFQNSFHFDDAHTIVNNAAIRELGNIPRFFTDATTFSSLPSNQSYRPLVSTLLAIDYWLGASSARTGGLNPFWFHLSIFTLFIGLVFVVAFVIKRLLDEQPPSRWNWFIALGVAALYGLHPANAETVNYVIASAEIISALGVLGSFALYFAFPKLRRYDLFVLPAALAILAKPPAAIFVVLFAVYRFIFPNEQTRLRRATQIAELMIICTVLLFFVQFMTPRSWVSGATDAHKYLITQPYVALLYFKTFFWPSGLSADYDLNPLSSTNDPRFWIGIIFVASLLTMSTCLAVALRRRILAARLHSVQVIGFGLLWFLIALLPTSLFPLAEPMNDHRTFLPYIGLVIALAGAISVLFQTQITQARLTKTVIPFAILLILSLDAYATFQRNRVWKTEETLWHDVTIKSPRNGRGLMNYGNTLMAKGDFAGALDYFHRALQLTPNYSALFVNLAIAEDATKQSAAAEQHFRDALRLAPASPDSYTYYARYLLSHSRVDEARLLLQSALELSPTDMTARDLLAKANGQNAGQREMQTPEYYLDLSLQRYQEGRYAEAIVACRAALQLRPDYAEAWNNICAAYNNLGRFEEAGAACEQALRHKPDYELARNNLQYAREKLKALGKQ